MIEYKQIDEKTRGLVSRFFAQQYGSKTRVVNEELIDLMTLDGIVALEGFNVEGVMTYRIRGDLFEIITVDSRSPGQGIGTMLTSLAVEMAKQQGLARVGVTTGNDNIEGIGFYQKLGFDLKEVRRDALSRAREIKESIPHMGKNGILLRHEIYFEMEL